MDPEFFSLSDIDNYITQLTKIEDAFNEYRSNRSLEPLYRLNSDKSSSEFLRKWMELARLPEPDAALEQLGSREFTLSQLSPYSDIMLHCQKEWDRAVDLIHVVYIYSGKFSCVMKDRELTLTEGMCYMFNVNVPKRILPADENAMLLNCLISRNYLENTLFKQFDRNAFFSDFLTQSFYTDSTSAPMLPFDTTGNREVKYAFAMAIIEYTNQLPLHQSMIYSYISQLLIQLLRIHMENRDRENYLALGNNRLSSILVYIDNHCDTATLESVAEVFHFHPSYLSRIIKQNTNLTFTSIIQNTRLKHAAELLMNTEQSVTEIAHQVGYNNITHFYRLFQEKYRITPAEYRDRHRSASR